MKAVVVYYSLEGNTKLTAEKTAEKLGADIIALKPVKAYPDKGAKKFFFGGKSATFKEKPELEGYDFDTEKYDTVILGTPLWAGTISPPLRTFLSENDISEKRAAAFICCSGGNTAKGFDAIKTESGISGFIAEMVLVDPLKKGADIDEKVSEFCRKINM